MLYVTVNTAYCLVLIVIGHSIRIRRDGEHALGRANGRSPQMRQKAE